MPSNARAQFLNTVDKDSDERVTCEEFVASMVDMFGAQENSNILQGLEKAAAEGEDEAEDFDEIPQGMNESQRALREKRRRDRRRRRARHTITFGDREFAVLGTDTFLFSPFSPAMQTFDIVVVALLLVTLITTPLVLAFARIERTLAILDLCIDAVFLIDVVRNFFSAYITDDEVVVFDHAQVSKHYVSTWCLPDLILSCSITHRFQSTT